MRITVSAPGKIHLLGEHAVVYGRPALLSAVNLRVFVTISQGIQEKDGEKIRIESPISIGFIRQIVSVLQEKFPFPKPLPVTISVQSRIPSGSGMGSSAAVTAAVVGAWMKASKNIWNPTRINELTYEMEKLTHGNPSGADNTAVVFGGLVWFRKEFEFLKSIWTLPVSSYTFPRLFLLQTGKPVESTKEMVDTVWKKYQKRKSSFEKLFSNQEVQTKKLLLSFKEGNVKDMEEAILSGERNLEHMGVVGETAGKILREIEKSEGCGKISGAGGVKRGSGIAVCFHECPEVLQRIAKKYKRPLFPVTFGEEGIRIEQYEE